METSAFDLALRFVGVKETPGVHSTPIVLAMLKLDDSWPDDDDVPWCSAFVNSICWLLRLPRSKSLAARSWLQVGREIPLEQASPGFDVVVLERGAGGHVGFYAGTPRDPNAILLLGGNQRDSVCVSSFPMSRVLGIRRLRD